MKYGKRSSIPTWRKNELAMSTDDQSEEKVYCKRNARNLSEKKRRDQFNVLILELCSMVSTSRTRKMDKSAVLKETINFLKTHNEMALRSEENAIQETWKPSFLSDDEFSQLMLEALDGFMIVFSQQGHILYASDSIISLLRHLPKDLKSSTIYELVHEDDRPEIFKILMEADAKKDEPKVLRDKRYNFLCRIRKGSLEPSEKVQYEAVRFNGSFSFFKNSEAKLLDMGDQEEQCCFVATVRLQNSQLTREMAMSTEKEKEFASRHSLDWKFLFLDQRGPPVLGYLPFEVLGTSVYDYYHHDDLEKLTQCHEALMQTGEGTSCYYRYLTKGQEWIWLQTRYFITYNQWNSKPEFIVCTHRVVSYAEVRKCFNNDIAFTDESSISTEFSNKWSSNGCLSEISPSLNSSSGESSVQSSVQRSIASEVIYKSSETTDPVSNGRNQLRYAGNLATTASLPNDMLNSSRADNSNQVTPSVSSSENQSTKNLNITDQMKVIQVKLQKQLVARHQKLQEDILRQQQELQNVQQQLLNAQQLMFQQQSPVMGMSLDQTSTRGQKASPPPVKGGNWKTAGGLVHHQPAVTEAWSMNLPMQQSLNVSPSPVYNQASMSMSSPQLASPMSQSRQVAYHVIPSSNPMDTNLQSPTGSEQELSLPETDGDRLAFPSIINAIRNPGASSSCQGVPNHQTLFHPHSPLMMVGTQEQGSSCRDLLSRTNLPSSYNNQQLLPGGNSSSMLEQDMGAFLNPAMPAHALELYDDMGMDPSVYLGALD
ncbi:uncharacterized protein [Apostichopus japonicus]|uniref:uncharacterized protein isoform X2 n=1 Tax=Stichopus japonicus TaxID=307972 RepID=UPI003AB2CF50